MERQEARYSSVRRRWVGRRAASRSTSGGRCLLYCVGLLCKAVPARLIVCFNGGFLQEQKSLKDQIKRLGKKGKEEAAVLQAALDERHQEELEAFDTAVKLQEMSVQDEDSQLRKSPRMSKAMKRKQQRQQEEAEREARIEAELAVVGETARQREENTILEQLAPRGLAIHDIPADGHCLYRALEHQLRLRAGEPSSVAEPPTSETPSYVELRRLAATYMREHGDEFRPFITEVEPVLLFYRDGGIIKGDLASPLYLPRCRMT